jgi:hypothetical protein
LETITPLPFKLNGRSLRRLKLLSRHKNVYFWANHGDELQPKKVVKSEIELGLPFMALDLVYKS